MKLMTPMAPAPHFGRAFSEHSRPNDGIYEASSSYSSSQNNVNDPRGAAAGGAGKLPTNYGFVLARLEKLEQMFIFAVQSKEKLEARVSLLEGKLGYFEGVNFKNNDMSAEGDYSNMNMDYGHAEYCDDHLLNYSTWTGPPSAGMPQDNEDSYISQTPDYYSASVHHENQHPHHEHPVIFEPESGEVHHEHLEHQHHEHHPSSGLEEDSNTLFSATVTAPRTTTMSSEASGTIAKPMPLPSFLTRSTLGTLTFGSTPSTTTPTRDFTTNDVSSLNTPAHLPQFAPLPSLASTSTSILPEPSASLAPSTLAPPSPPPGLFRSSNDGAPTPDLTYAGTATARSDTNSDSNASSTLNTSSPLRSPMTTWSPNKSIRIFQDESGKTTKVMWRVDNIKSKLKMGAGKPLVSPQFRLDSIEEGELKLMLFPYTGDELGERNGRELRTRERQQRFEQLVNTGPLGAALRIKASGQHAKTLKFRLWIGDVDLGTFETDFSDHIVHGTEGDGVKDLLACIDKDKNVAWCTLEILPKDEIHSARMDTIAVSMRDAVMAQMTNGFGKFR